VKASAHPIFEDAYARATPAARSLRQQEPEEQMHILGMIVIGLIVGALAKLFMPGKDPGGIIVTILLGIAGSVVAGFFGRTVGWYRVPGQTPGIIASILGAMFLLLIYRVVVGRRKRLVGPRH
jgi:uncharacterized membrane protein YeaQ/YmgE (transglycosylase-associated protein family)